MAALVALVVVAGVLVGNVLHRLVIPLPAPDPSTYPRPGDVLSSRSEGFEQRVLAVRDGWIVSELVIAPGAAGPPKHYHRSFVEAFTVTQGTLHIELDDGIVQVPAGESYTVPIGVAHRPFNPTDEPVVITSDAPIMPLTFAACLVQLYSVMDESGTGPGMLLQMSVIDPICDTHLAALPPGGETLLRWLLGPIARLAGYRNYYPERALHPTTSA